MDKKMIGLACAVLLAVFGAALTNAGDTTDSDEDGIPDGWDNCVFAQNATQLDSDLDGYGNACDCDKDQNLACDGNDFLIFGANFGLAVPPGNPNCDFDGNLAIDGNDFLIFGQGFGGLPGPSGLPCAGQVPCQEDF